MRVLADATPDSLRASLDAGPMTRGQVVAVVAAVLLAGLDGYDVQAMSFVAPVVSKAWSIDKATLGLVLASSLFGMAGGSIGLSPLADVLGRRPVMLGGVALMTLGSVLSALSHTVGQLAASRVVTGLGIGVMISITTILAAEFASARRRGLAVASTTTFFGVGGVLGGFAAAGVLRAHTWPWVFAIGALAGAVLLVVAAFALPESPAFLMDRAPKDALRRLNGVLRRLGRPPLSELPEPVRAERASYRALFTQEMAGVTLRFALVYLLVVTAAYYLLSWLPQLVADAGFAPSTGGLVMASSSLVGIPAGLIFGVLAARLGALRLASWGMIGFGASLAALGLVPPVLALLILAASACGFFLQATTAVFYATMASTFPPLTRVSGMGFVMGFGRLFSGIGPFLAGVLFASGWTRPGVSIAFAAAAAAGGLVLIASRRRLSAG